VGMFSVGSSKQRCRGLARLAAAACAAFLQSVDLVEDLADRGGGGRGAEAAALVQRLGWSFVETERGFRRVVASPEPRRIRELRTIEILVDAGVLVVCAGGGGIPVIATPRGFRGVEAVIDKDLVSARLAAEIGVDHFLIATDVPGAAIHHGTPEEKYLRDITLKDLEAYLAQGHFPTGSMRPKVEAALSFVRNGGRPALIAGLGDIEKALAGKAGTRVLPG